MQSERKKGEREKNRNKKLVHRSKRITVTQTLDVQIHKNTYTCIFDHVIF